MVEDSEENQDSQNLEVNIDKIYSNFINELNKIRSLVSVYNNPEINDFFSAKAPSNKTTYNVLKTPQESRCNAFYRLLGLPVTDGESIYTPGFDKPNNSNLDILDKKNNIAKKILENKEFKEALNAREIYPKENEYMFSKQDVNSMVMAMGSASIRSFKLFEKLDNPLDTDLKNQSYDVPLVQRLIKTVTHEGISANKADIGETWRHILMPLIVDPRLDMNVLPKSNMMAVPFLKDKTETELSDGIFLKRPYIEKVCRDRFDIRPKLIDLGSATQSIINNIKNDPYIASAELIKQAFDPNKITSESLQLANYINSIKSVLSSLYSAINTVTIVLAADPNSNGTAIYNWTPIPNVLGPEYGCITRDLVKYQSKDPNNKIKDFELIEKSYKAVLESISNKLNSVKSPDIGNFAFDGLELTPDNNSSDSIKFYSETHVSDLLKEREHYTDAANLACQQIEIIMGEFSGLGLIDILVFCAALWAMDKKFLLGLLDDIAINRMASDPNLQSEEVMNKKNNPQISTPRDSLSNFQKKIKELYDITDKLWQEIRYSNKFI